MTSFRPHAEYSRTADAVYVQLLDAEVDRTRSLGDRRMIDLVEELLKDFHFRVFA